MKYRIMSNNYPYSIIIADNFESEAAALAYAHKMIPFWCFGHYMWHIEEYRPE